MRFWDLVPGVAKTLAGGSCFLTAGLRVVMPLGYRRRGGSSSSEPYQELQRHRHSVGTILGAFCATVFLLSFNP
jgi:hypothetical protein